MARNTIRIERSIHQVFEELLRAENFATWVVGAKRVRGTSGGWPSVGAELHHTVGLGPLKIADRTRIEELDPPVRLVLDARAWPAGEAEVVLSLSPADVGATRVVMDEKVVAGLATLVPEAITQRLIHLRNRRSLRRLRRLVMDRQG